MANCTNNHAASSRGFTLIELLVAIAVLLVVILATSRIFGTASQVAGLGQASANVMQEAIALERRLREDIANLSHEGFFAIRQVAVPNDINVPEGPLLNPFLPDDAIIRADQLVFFTTSVATPQTAGIGGAMSLFGQSTSSRVYYGHGVQIPGGGESDPAAGAGRLAHDPGVQNDYPTLQQDFQYLLNGWTGIRPALTPWRRGPIGMVRTSITAPTGGGGFGGTGVYERSGDGLADATQPDALNWLLTRQTVALLDDDELAPNTNDKTVAFGVRTARSIFIDHPGHGHSREIRNARLDAAATELHDIRRYVQWRWNDGQRRPWNNLAFGGGVNADQRSIIASSIYYPRAERYAPGMHRVDQSLTNHVIGSNVSSFIVEWTWEEGAGEVRDEQGNLIPTPLNLPIAGDNDYFYGFRPNCWNSSAGSAGDWCLGSDGFHQPEQVWFGLNWPERGVGFMGFEDSAVNTRPEDVDQRDYYLRANFDTPIAVSIADGMNNDDNNVERYFGPGQQPPFNPYGTSNDIRIYEALFGYNRDTPLDRYGFADASLGYTPWPTAIRVTVVFHDPAGRMEHGREFQFVIDLPRRTK